MDLEKLDEKSLKSYFLNPELNNYRKETKTLTEQNALLLLTKLKNNLVKTEELQKAIILAKEKGQELEQFYPMLFIDFDNFYLYSQFSEFVNFEDYVPDFWQGKYADFTNLVPANEKYWLINNKNIFED